eukprot:Skav206612  [mRNA]  locus=scaffold1562:77884:84170:+ [translate_table: standard]
MEEVQTLRANFIAAGGSESEFDRLGHGGLGLGDEAFHDGGVQAAEARRVAVDLLSEGTLLEYHCYNDQGRSQGMAVIRFKRWLSMQELKFAGDHLVASDGYYEWWAQRHLSSDRTEYHFCETARNKCKVRATRGIEGVHLLRWRLVSPQTLLGVRYAKDIALAELKIGADALLLAKSGPGAPAGAHPAGPAVAAGPAAAAVPGGPLTSGLDEEMGRPADLDDPRIDELMTLAKKAKRGPPDVPRGNEEHQPKKRRSFGGDLLQRAQVHEERGREKERSKEKARRSRTRSGGRKKDGGRRGRSRDDDDYSQSSDGKGSSDDEGQVFREASHREVDLVKLSQRNPGCLLRSALREMNRYMAARGEAMSEDQAPNRVLSYLHQILLPQFPKAGLRSQRELVTLATSLDMLLDGNLGGVGDVLAQRFKAIESSLAAEGNWQVARHHELIPSSATLATKAELSEAAKAEARALSSSQATSRWSGDEERSGSEVPTEGSWSTSSQRSVSVSAPEGGPEEEREWAEVRRFAYNCWQLDTSSKSMSQMAVLLVQVVHNCPGVVGAHSKDLIEAASKQGTGIPWKDVLPLPVPDEVMETIDEVLGSVEFKVKKRSGMTGGAVRNAYRKVGIDCLVYCMIVGLNCMWGGLRRGTRVHQGQPRAGQMAAVERLKLAAVYVIDSKDGAEKGGIPRTPTQPWEDEIRASTISYQGEIVERAEPLEVARVLASLPPEGFGGAVDILDLCEGKVKEMLSDPKKCLLPADEMPQVLPQPRVLVKQGEWEQLAKALYDRGIIEPTEEVISLHDRLVTNGLFGVKKVGKDLPDGRPAQRLIMDLRGSNSVLKIIGGDIATLAGASAFTNIILEDGKLISISGDDLCSSFYLFRLPSSWKPYLTFEKKVAWKALGIQAEGDTYMSACVLPMGFASSVGIMQHLHRRLALWSQEQGGGGLPAALELRKDRQWPHLEDYTPVWCLYLDDSTFLKKMDVKVEESLAGRPLEEQENMRRAYQFWGIPYNSKKAIEDSEQAERLGSFLDGRRGRVGVTVKRLLESLSLGIWVLGQGQVSQKALQVLGGKEVHTLQFRRPLFSVYDEIWKLIMDPSGEPYLNRKVCCEIVTSMALAPLRFTDWRCELDPYVMATDASESGGGFVIAKGLSRLGRMSALQPEGRDDSLHNGVIVIDFFAGIGGMLRSLQRCGLKWEHHVVIEKDPGCRRLIRRTWPGGSEFTDIEKVTLDDLKKEIKKMEAPKLVVAGGGSPCQGLSKLSSKRKHFADQRSGLFYNMADHLAGLQKFCQDEAIQFLGVVENVVMDEEDRDEITMKLGYRPHLCESGDISRVKRPRFYWLSEDLPPTPWYEVTVGQVANSVRLKGPLEPDALWLPEGFKWSGTGSDLRFPTFTRPIIRSRPPIDPAGLKGASQEARMRWKEDRFRSPPYVYESKFLIESPAGTLHKLPAHSREVLMGYRQGHTARLDRELFEKSSLTVAQDAMQAAVGNAFHTTTVALLLGPILGELGFLHWVKGPEQLLADLVMEHEDHSLSEVETASDKDDSLAASSLARLEFDEEVMQPECEQEDLNEEVQSKILMSRLVGHFLRKVEIKGSDIRLDSDVIFKPNSCPRSAIDPSKWTWRHGRAFRWRFSQHINVLELKALLHSLQWRSRRSGYHSFRTMLLCDSQAVIAVVAKGKLSDLVVKAGTLQKYHQQFNRFHDWATANQLPLNTALDIDATASQYIEGLWADGFGRAEASYFVAALQFMLPHIRHHLPLSWRLVKTWSRHEMPTRAVPLDAHTVVALASLFQVWDEPRLAAGIIVAFDFFLRTGELFTIRRNQVEFAGTSATLQLLHTKTGSLKLQSERLLAWDRLAVQALRFLCQGKQPGDLLLHSSAPRFRLLWHRAVAFFQLNEFFIQPYSLRRGGATSAFRRGASFDQLLVRGRWSHVRTARIYLDEALQQSSALSFPPAARMRLRLMRSRFNGFAK